MSAQAQRVATWRHQARAALVIVRKNALLYYLKAPVLIFGVLFPVFFFLAFKMGRPIPVAQVVPGMIAMALWFTASAVGPLVTPWERQARTYERLIAAPVSLPAMLAGDVLSGLIFGLGLSLIPIAIGLALTDASLADPLLLLDGIGLGAVSFAALGVLLASPPVSGPASVMLLSNLVRLPLLFVSGIFVPIAEMPGWARWVAPASPLSYAGDLIRGAFGQPMYFSVWLCTLMLIVFAAVQLGGAWLFHRRWRAVGL